MINCLKTSLKIDMTVAINSFIYVLRKLPIFRDLFTDDIYKSRKFKKFVRILGIILSMGRMILFRFLYFLVIYFICSYISPKHIVDCYIHVYFIFMIIGMFINNKLLNTSTKKYFSIILFGMDAKTYLFSDLYYNLILNFILNGVSFIVLSIVLKLPVFMGIILVLSGVVYRILGEACNILFYKKHDYIWTSNGLVFFLLVISLIGISLLPYFNMFVPSILIYLLFIIISISNIFCFKYLYSINDYKLIYKRLNTKESVMSGDEAKSYSKQSMVAIKDKDRDVSLTKIKGKKGYDLFNTIFFERHREILSRSAKVYSFIIIGIYLLFIILCVTSKKIAIQTNDFLLNNMGWFVFVMYFINRGSIITRAMFFNCDHAMLSYNFYREPKVLLGLFKKRLTTVTLVNLVPAILIGIGNVILINLTGGIDYINSISNFCFIILLSIFFSVHYLVIYYLLQPYNKDMEVKKASYSIITFLTYYLAFLIKDLVFSSLMFSILGGIFTTIYIILSLIIVYRFAPKTFKLNN